MIDDDILEVSSLWRNNEIIPILREILEKINLKWEEISTTLHPNCKSLKSVGEIGLVPVVDDEGEVKDHCIVFDIFTFVEENEPTATVTKFYEKFGHKYSFLMAGISFPNIHKYIKKTPINEIVDKFIKMEKPRIMRQLEYRQDKK